MIEVNVRDSSDGAFEKAMSVFKKKVSNAGYLQEINERRYYKKPSEVAREKKRKQKSQK